MTRGASPQEMAECCCLNPWWCEEKGCGLKRIPDTPIGEGDPRWHWRNCRAISVEFALFVWPWHLGWGSTADVYGCRLALAVGPIGLAIECSIGDVSREPWTIFHRLANWTGLSEEEAYERAERWEARP